MDNINLDMTELAALVSVIGAGAAYLSTQGGGSDEQTPVYEIGEGFGEDDGAEGTDETDVSDGLNDSPGITEPDTTDPSEGDWSFEDPTNNPDSPEYEDPDLDFGDSTPYDDGWPDGTDGGSDDTTDDGIEWGGPTGSDQAGTGEDRGDDDPASGPSPGDTTTGGTGIGTSEPLIDYDDVAGVGDHLAGSTDEWVGGLW
jgi:hypothetical protein